MSVSRPLQAIRSYCQWCCCGDSNEVRLCSASRCSLYNHRLGNHTYDRGSYSSGNESSGKCPVAKVGKHAAAIRQKCLSCSGNEIKDVVKCPYVDCQLYAYRKGKPANRSRP